MKGLVRREKPFRKTVPAKAEFVHFVRSEGVSVGKRNQLNARGSECIKAWQLAATRRESQWKRLNTVAKEISSGEQIAGVETVVNLGDEASQLIERRGDNGSLFVRQS